MIKDTDWFEKEGGTALESYHRVDSFSAGVVDAYLSAGVALGLGV